jgi:hypothetical protein
VTWRRSAEADGLAVAAIGATLIGGTGATACMSKAKKYQRFAEACLQITSAAKDPLSHPHLRARSKPPPFRENTLMTVISGLIGQPRA